MIGFWGFLEEFSFVFFPMLVLLAVIVAARRTSNGNRGFSAKGIVVLIVLIALPMVTGWKFVQEVRWHLFFSSLASEDVESFSVGGQLVTDPDKKSVLVQSLRKTEWFSPHHDGWAAPVDFRVRLKSGREKNIRIATYLREPGVALDFGTPKGRGGLHAGYAFSKSLPAALSQMGIGLPR